MITETLYIVNFRIYKISQNIYKLIQPLILIIIKKFPKRKADTIVQSYCI
jgi:hypothetical protein